MGQRMNTEKPECGGTMNQNGSGDAILALPASEQLATRSCARCAGLLLTPDQRLAPTGYLPAERTT